MLSPKPPFFLLLLLLLRGGHAVCSDIRGEPWGRALSDIDPDTFPDTLAYIASVHGVVDSVFVAPRSGLLLEVGYSNSSGAHSLQTRVPWRSRWEQLVTECTRRTAHCPLLSFGHESDKPVYWNKAVKRTAKDVAWGLRENARMLRLIQEKSNVALVVMYGSLIGWWWSEESLPWDTDIDVHVLDVDTFEAWLTALPRMTFDKHEHRNGRENVHHYNLSVPDFTMYFDHNAHHHIEYRLIHIPTGVYTDMTTLVPTPRAIAKNKVVSRPAVLDPTVFAMKASFSKLWGGHLYNLGQIEPLRPCTFNGFELWCPNQVESVLRQKYRRFDNPTYKNAVFNSTSKCWEIPLGII
jgi:hypothetical protein